MKVLLILLALSISCLSKGPSTDNQFIVVDQLWTKKMSLDDVKERLGQPDLEQKKIAQYYSPGTKRFRLHFEFDDEKRVVFVVMLLGENLIEEFKSSMPCTWEEKRGHQQIVDYITLSHEGKCKEKALQFKFSASLGRYEIRWGDDQ